MYPPLGNNKVKKPFKRLLSTVLALAMLCSCMVIANVGTVFASLSTSNINTSTTTVWDFLGITSSSTVTGTGSSTDTATVVASSGGYQVTTEYTSSNTGIVLTADSNKGAKINSASNLTGNYIKVPVTAGDVIYVYAHGNNSTSSSYTLYFCINETYSTDNSASFTGSRGNVNELSYTVPNSYSGDLYIVTASNTNIPAVARVRTTSSSETKTETTTETTTEETTEGETESTTEEVTETTTYIAVEPTNNSDGSITYDFTSAGTGTLYNETNKTSDTTAYSNDKGGCSVTLSESGAYLYDDSGASTSDASDKNSNASTLYVPYSASSGVVNFTGSFETKDNVGSKWNLVNFGVIAICTNDSGNSRYLDFATSNDANSTGDYTLLKNTTYTYDVTINFDSKKASAKIYANGDVVARFTNVSISGSSMSTISFTTNGSGNETAGSARTLVIPSVTITDISDEKEYVYFGITEDQAQNSSSYTISDFKSAITTGNKAYTGVNLGNGDIETSSLRSYENFITEEGTDASSCIYVIAYILDTATVDLDTLSIAFTAITTDDSDDSSGDGDGSTEEGSSEASTEAAAESSDANAEVQAAAETDADAKSADSEGTEADVLQSIVMLTAESIDIGTAVESESASEDTAAEESVSDGTETSDDTSSDDTSGDDGSSDDSSSDDSSSDDSSSVTE